MNGPNGDGPKSWVQFDEESSNDQNARGEEVPTGEVGSHSAEPPTRSVTPPHPLLGPVSPSKQVQETPPKAQLNLSSSTSQQPILPPPPQKQPRTTSPVPLSQLPNNPLAPSSDVENQSNIVTAQATLPPPPQKQPRPKSSESTPAVIDTQSVQVFFG